MRRFTRILILFACLLFVAPSAEAWFSNDALVTIDGTRYSAEDFKRWWTYWKEPEQPLPKTTDPYVDWLLLAREGEQMDLASDPSFQHRSRVFLQVRSLLLLQKEEVNDRIEVSESDIRARYQELYTPMWLLQRLQFKDEDSAEATRQELAKGILDIDELLERPAEEGGPMAHREDWRRPVGIDPEWADTFRALDVGDTTKPLPFDDHFVFYRLKLKEDGSPEDFAKLQERLRKDLWKEQEEVKTQELLGRLRQKYDVKIDRDRLAALALSAPDDAYGDAHIISTNRQNVTEKDFIAILRRDKTLLMGHNLDEAKKEELKTRVVDGIINQNLTNWESLDRQYHEREPFKWEYQFNVDHRLTRAVAERLFVLDDPVSREEIEKTYQENIARYSQPELVRFSIVEDVDGEVDRIWGDVLTGTDFSRAVMEHTRKKDTPTDMPYSHLDLPVQEVIDKLAKGETSQPFEAQGHRFIVRLIDRTPARPIPLEKVAESIRANLEREKLAQKRQSYLDQLKSRSQIKVSSSAWRSVQKELGEAK